MGIMRTMVLQGEVILYRQYKAKVAVQGTGRGKAGVLPLADAHRAPCLSLGTTVSIWGPESIQCWSYWRDEFRPIETEPVWRTWEF